MRSPKPILLYCFGINDDGTKHCSHDYSAIVYAKRGRLDFGNFRYFEETLGLNEHPYTGGNPLPTAAELGKSRFDILHEEPIPLF